MRALRFVSNRWSDPPAGEVEQLIHRSRALGADLAVTNFAGGNTSCKTTAPDPITGEPIEVLWVKGSGGDLGTLTRAGLATLSLPALQALKRRYRGAEHEDEMADLLWQAVFDRNPVAPSIDTPLHGFVPARHVDHLHPDAIIALAVARDGEHLVGEIFGAEILWLPYRRPGWELGLMLERALQANPNAHGVVLGGHGLMTWGDTAQACYATSLDVIDRAAEYLDRHGARVGDDRAFGAIASLPLAADERRRRAAAIAPTIRGLAATDRRVIGCFTDAPEVLDFLSRAKAPALADMGTSCPDHFLRTKLRPLVISSDDPDEIRARHGDYRRRYSAYYDAHRSADSPPMRGADPVVVLLSGVGMWTFGADAKTARLAGEYYVNAINAMRGAEAVSTYAPIDDLERFRIEYWALEEAKLKRQPPPKPLAGKVALVVGGASGIGRAVGHRLAAEGAVVVVADVNGDGAVKVAAEIGDRDRAVGTTVDVRDEASVAAMLESACLAFGGIDIVVLSAGLARSRPLGETSVGDWDLQHDVMVRGSFLVAREAARVMRAQGIGGDLVVIGSKNAVVAGPENVAYGSAKAAQEHMVRLLAAELGGQRIRVNGVNPDAVVRGSGIFAGEWTVERAKAYGVAPDELGKFYAGRTLLKEEIFPEDIAAAVFVLVGSELRKTTGLIIPVDGGLSPAFLR